MYGKVTIYALKNPNNNKIFYVGRSTRVESRFLQHMSEAKKFKNDNTHMLDRLFGISEGSITVKSNTKDHKGTNVRKLNKINEILEEGIEPELIILDEWDECPSEEDAGRLEDAWIAIMRSRLQPITNYLYSRRMSPTWYGKSNKYYRDGWADTPEQYIEMLKEGKTGSQKESSIDETRKYTRQQRKRLAKKNYRKHNSKKNKKRRKK